MARVDVCSAGGLVLQWLAGKALRLDVQLNSQERDQRTATQPRHTLVVDGKPFDVLDDWLLIGRLIHQQGMSVGCYDDRPPHERWHAYFHQTLEAFEHGFYSRAATPMEAFWRCYVASRLGEQVEVPEALVICA